MSKFFKELWNKTRGNGKLIGFIFIILVVLVIYFILLNLFITSDLIGIYLGSLSVVLACIAIFLSKKADKKYTEILNRMPENIVKLLQGQDMIVQPTGNVIVMPQPAALVIETFAPEVIVEHKSKESAQKRLDEDTKRVGYVRGELYQLKDGSWGIRWGGKYPL